MRTPIRDIGLESPQGRRRRNTAGRLSVLVRQQAANGSGGFGSGEEALPKSFVVDSLCAGGKAGGPRSSSARGGRRLAEHLDWLERDGSFGDELVHARQDRVDLLFRGG